MSSLDNLQHQLTDRRSRKVIFLAHCLLNENTRYLGGACSAGCVRAVVEPCIARGNGIVQLPCPEQEAWGGVLKRWLVLSYGSKGRETYRWRGILVPLFVAYTRIRYERIARRIANQMRDYVNSGFTVQAVVGINGSPSCGVTTTLDLAGTFERIAALDVGTITPNIMTALLQAGVQPGRGLFIAALQRALVQRKLTIPFLAHDLIAELAGTPSRFDLPPDA